MHKLFVNIIVQYTFFLVKYTSPHTDRYFSFLNRVRPEIFGTMFEIKNIYKMIYFLNFNKIILF